MTAPVLDVGSKYVYTIQARDIEGKDVFKNGGVSQPCWFYYGYPLDGIITLSQPSNLGGFGNGDPLFFKWSSPSRTISGQYFYYKLKIVKFDSTQAADDAILNNPVWYEETTLSTNKQNGFDIVLNKKLDPQTDYAWQVTAYTDGMQIAQSPVYTFYGPPLIDWFMAGMHQVKVKSTFNRDLTNLSGVALVQLSADGKTQEVPFNNLRILDEAGRYVLNYGALTANLADTTSIQLTPEKQENLYAYFHPKKFKLDKQSLELYGNITWALPHVVLTPNKPFVVSQDNWINFDKYKLNGNAILIFFQSVYFSQSISVQA
jgi:hypothetical protein